jgi:putative ABC transport system permease protein
VIINEAMARRYWPDQSPIGKRISLEGARGPFTEIVGVVKTTKYRQMREDALPYMYLPFSQMYQPEMNLIVRTAGDPTSLVPALRAEVQRLDQNIPLFGVRTLTEHLADALAPERTNAALSGIFGLLALLLAGVGMYGVMSYTVTERTREIGIRAALGAQRADVLRLIMGQGMILTVFGVLTGLGAAFALKDLIASLLFGVSAADPVTFAVIPLVLTAVALLACYLPARRATKVDPMIALRYE